MRLISIEKASLFIPGDPARKLVLRDIDLEIRQGRHYALLGPNGAGKSTLLRFCAGLLWPSSGKISWRTPEGMDDSPLSGRAIAELVSPAMQENLRRQAWGISVRDFLLAGMTDSRVKSDKPAMIKEIAAMAEDLDFTLWLNEPLPVLSQGQLRLILLARALLRRPEILLLDECMDGLDASHKEKLFACLARPAASALVFAGHRGDALPPWIHEIIYLDDGRRVSEIAETPPPSPARPRSREIPPRAGAPLIVLKNANIYIDRRLCVKNVCWTIREGENWRVKGPNGSGKSTLLRLLAGDEFAAAGGFCRRFFAPEDTLENTRRHVRLVSDLGQALYGYPLSGLELVCSGFDNSIGIYREFQDWEISLAKEAIARSFPHAWKEIAESSIRRLSTGQLRRLHLARALVTFPTLLLLDEACSGLDKASRIQFLNLVDDLAINGFHGKRLQIVFVSHYDEELPCCLNREASMENGCFFIKN